MAARLPRLADIKNIWAYRKEIAGITLGSVAVSMLSAKIRPQLEKIGVPSKYLGASSKGLLGIGLFVFSEIAGGLLRQFQPIVRYSGIASVGLALLDLLRSAGIL